MTTEMLFYVEESVEGRFEAIAINHSIYTQCEDSGTILALFNQHKPPQLCDFR